MTAKQFFSRALLILAFLLCLLASFNFLVNPARMFAMPDIDGFNRSMSNFFLGMFVSQPYIFCRDAPEVVILGTSRAGASLRTDHPAWAGRRVYNFALPGSTAVIQWRNFQHASATGELEMAVVSLDFLMFNSCNPQQLQPHFQEYLQRLRGGDSSNTQYPQRWLADHLAELTGWSTLLDSWSTIQAQSRFADGKEGGMHLLADGFWQTCNVGGARQRRSFKQVEQRHMNSGWFPPPLDCFELRRPGSDSQFEYLRRLLEQAYQQDTHLVVYFSPFHARFAEAMHAVGLWPLFEQLKRELLQVNQELSAQYQRQPYLIWDFSGYNPVTTEPVPAMNDVNSKMKYFFDSTHSTPLTGKLIQDVLFATGDTGEAPAKDFGRLLQLETLDDAMAADRAGRASWIEAFPDDVSEINDLASQSPHAVQR